MFRFWYCEALLFILFVTSIFAISSNTPLQNPEFVPNVVNGLATMSGIMTAFTGYLLSYIIRETPNTPKRWKGIRVVVLMLAIGFGLIFEILGFQQLVYGSVEGAYSSALFGCTLILLSFFEVMFMIFLKELEQITDLSRAF